jgi:hypothetical protein
MELPAALQEVAAPEGIVGRGFNGDILLASERQLQPLKYDVNKWAVSAPCVAEGLVRSC